MVVPALVELPEPPTVMQEDTLEQLKEVQATLTALVGETGPETPPRALLVSMSPKTEKPKDSHGDKRAEAQAKRKEVHVEQRVLKAKLEGARDAVEKLQKMTPRELRRKIKLFKKLHKK